MGNTLNVDLQVSQRFNQEQNVAFRGGCKHVRMEPDEGDWMAGPALTRQETREGFPLRPACSQEGLSTGSG